ncbi:sigma factor-like helix-turn-helix DNA-binding protein [Sphingopyxis sp. 2PD]|jgi:RNA polymerase sigma-70 factor (ECF subfamily)|uniref:sigma factor-like helix-turn-helix DNA-binding protein n=1 Tax=Sphingopyxis sp. 2PD TaxID=2502196 RepID=UPI0010F8B695|nr:sigma factor-like helix-turn-helix DNA-binding protein [Sphingopyxis sp. 2PD]
MADDNLAARFARTIRDLLAPPPVVPSFDENVDPEISRIEWAIARLPKRTRDVFLMHRFDDLPYDRIAHRLGISERAVEREIARVLRAIRKAREEHARELSK